MSRLLEKARRLADDIEHYHAYAGPNGFVQAKFPMNELSDLMRQANRSNKTKNDVPLIHDMYLSMKPLMEEMEQRQAEDDMKNSSTDLK